MDSPTNNARQADAPGGAVPGTSEMGHLIREISWERTGLGAIEAWPDSLRRLLSLILSTRFPAAVFWGPQMLQLYNDGFRPLLGDKHPAALGMPAREVWSEAWPLIGAQLENALHGESTFQENVLVPLQRSGVLEEFYFTYSYSPILGEAGEVEGVLVICHDTTLEVLATAQLRRSEERLRTFVEAVSDVVYRVSADWSAALQVEGRGFLPDTRAPDWEWFERNVHPDDQERVMLAIQKAVREESVFEMEHKVQRLDGTMGWTFSRAIPVRDPQGRITEWFGAASDITAKKQAEQALLSAEKLAVVGRLASSIAHEINNPLEAVTNLLYLAVQTADPQTRQTLLLAQQELDRVSQITANTLRFNRQKSVAGCIDVVETMQSVLDLYQGRLRQAEIQVIFEKQDCPAITGLAGEIRQVFVNLVGNALDATKRGGVLKIRIRPATEWKTGKPAVRVTVADNGQGMSPKTRREIYKPFFTTKESTGTGLGLWISADVVSRHHGSISVRSSQAENASGTTFSLLFPIDAMTAK